MPLGHLSESEIFSLQRWLSSSSSSSAFPQLYLWGSPFRVRLNVTVFNPTIEVVTFRLHGWCMLGMFLLAAFICLGHECQDLLSLCDGMHRLDLSLCSRPKEFWGNGVRTILTPKKKSPLPEKFSPEEDQTHDAA